MSTQNDLQSRLPDPTRIIPEMLTIAGAMAKAVENGSIPRTTIGLMHLRAGQLIGSTYQTVRHTGELREAGETEDRITAVASWRSAPYFTDAERVALELVEAVLAPNPYAESVSDELFAKAAAYYDDKALWTLTLAIGQFCFFIPVSLIGKPIPGRAAGENWSK